MATTGRSSPSMSLAVRQHPVARALRRLLFLIAICLLGGLVAGVLAGGLGSRLAMRIVALLAPERDQGTLTHAQAIVGDISFDGTLFLIGAGGALGLLGGLLHPAVRAWMPGRAIGRGLTFGTLLLILFGSLIIEGNNPDFRRFVPSPVSVALFASLFVLYGVLLAAIVERLDRSGSGALQNRLVIVGGYALIATVAGVGLKQNMDALTMIF